MKTLKVNGDIISNDYKWIYDWLDYESCCPKDLDAVIASLEPAEMLTVEINSGGGDVQAGQQIYSTLKAISQEHSVEVHVQSMAASAASLIAMAGHEVKMSPVALLMIHNCSTQAAGDYRVMQHSSEVLQTVNAAIRQAYMEKTGIPEDELTEMMDKETWLTANQCVERGFADAIIRDEAPKVVTNAMIGRLSVTPEMVERVKAEKTAREAQEAAAKELLADLDDYGV